MLKNYAVKSAVKEKTLDYRFDCQGFNFSCVVPPVLYTDGFILLQTPPKPSIYRGIKRVLKIEKFH